MRLLRVKKVTNNSILSASEKPPLEKRKWQQIQFNIRFAATLLNVINRFPGIIQSIIPKYYILFYFIIALIFVFYIFIFFSITLFILILVVLRSTHLYHHLTLLFIIRGKSLRYSSLQFNFR